MRRGIAVALLHCLIVLSLAGKYAYDRTALPRVWAKAAPFDPMLPLRGRYVRLRLEAENGSVGSGAGGSPRFVVRDGRLVGNGGIFQQGDRWMIFQPVLFFIPEHAVDPSRRKPDEELWAEVSVPPEGYPRPVRLGVKKNGVLTPLP